MSNTPPYPGTPPYPWPSMINRRVSVSTPNNIINLSNNPRRNSNISSFSSMNNTPANNTYPSTNNYNNTMRKALMGQKVKKNRKTRKTRKGRNNHNNRNNMEIHGTVSRLKKSHFLQEHCFFFLFFDIRRTSIYCQRSEFKVLSISLFHV